MSKVQLKPGDYVRTEGMTEEQYHAVAKAFIDAGAYAGEYPGEAEIGAGWYIGWAARGIYLSSLCHSGCSPSESRSWFCGGRELTIEQVLGKQEPAPTIEQLLAKANRHAAKAAKHERKRAEHEAKRVEAVEKARQLMPGYTLEVMADWERDIEDQPSEDMTDPQNWKAGDVVECTGDWYGKTKGRHYVLEDQGGHPVDEDGDVRVKDDNGNYSWGRKSVFRWVSRPQGETK